jgi:hypothetical protein
MYWFEPVGTQHVALVINSLDGAALSAHPIRIRCGMETGRTDHGHSPVTKMARKCSRCSSKVMPDPLSADTNRYVWLTVWHEITGFAEDPPESGCRCTRSLLVGSGCNHPRRQIHSGPVDLGSVCGPEQHFAISAAEVEHGGVVNEFGRIEHLIEFGAGQRITDLHRMVQRFEYLEAAPCIINVGTGADPDRRVKRRAWRRNC